MKHSIILISILASIFANGKKLFMTENKELIRFLEAQNQMYLKALEEIKSGKKNFTLDVVYFSTN